MIHKDFKFNTNKLLYFIFLIFVLLFSISISNILVRHYVKPVIDENNNIKIERFRKFHQNFKKSINILKFNKENTYNCEHNNNLGERHRLRWVFQSGWNYLYKYGVYYFGETKIVYELYKILIGLLIFLSFLWIVLLDPEKEDFKNNTLPITGFFLSAFLLSSSSNISEIHFSILELFFLSLAFYLLFKKKFIPYILLCILAPMNRESGFILPLIYLIFYPNEFKKFILLLLVTTAIYFLINISVIQCILKPGFLITTEPTYETFSDFSFFSRVKIIFQDYALYLILLILFWKKMIYKKNY